jgi:DNA polymerase
VWVGRPSAECSPITVLSIDFETRATVDLRKTGVYPYAQHKDTGIWCMAWAFDDEEPEIWTPGMQFWGPYNEIPYMLPPRMLDHIAARGEIRAWNAQFERIIWNEIMVKRLNAPAVLISQWVCSAAEAAAMALPRSLDQAAKVVGVKHQKDGEGYNLMMRMTKPRKLQADGTPIWWDVEDRKARLFAYCKQDVRVERAIVKALRRLTPKEREVYLFDQRTNDRGLRIDTTLVRAAQAVADEGVERANGALQQITGGAVSEVTKTGQLKDWLGIRGVPNSSVKKSAVAELLESDLDPDVREALELRADSGRSSIAKLESMLHVLSTDGRARGLKLYHGASTGRWSGKLLQPDNFPRGEVDKVEQYIDYVLGEQYDTIDLFAHPVVVVLSLLRAMITAAPGHDLMAADFAAIEARVLNWLAGQTDVLALFRAMDAGDKTRHPYKRMAVLMGRASRPEDVIKPSEDYQAGKAAELGFGFGMGEEKFVTSAWSTYQVRVTKEQGKIAKDSYRVGHPQVVDFWYATERACRTAILQPGRVERFGGLNNVKAVVSGAYLYIVLPSGRPLCYAAPSVEDAPTPWGEVKPTIHYYGIDPLSRQWGKLRTYGGHLVENIVQAVARDLLAEGMLRLEAAGYPPVLHVHDEVVCEVPEGFGSVKDLEQRLAELPDWAAGCPVAAEGWRGFRYRK